MKLTGLRNRIQKRDDGPPRPAANMGLVDDRPAYDV